MTRERLVWVLALLGLALGAWWFTVNTEWVDEERRRSAQGEALDNPVYAVEQLLRRLGMQAEHHEALDKLPPIGARLVLLSSDWDLVPERAEQVHQWVLQGGHLVLLDPDDWDDTALAKWVHVESVAVKEADRPKPKPRRPAAVHVPGLTASAPERADKTELASTPPLWGDTELLATCFFFSERETLRAKRGQAVAWRLERTDATVGMNAVEALQDQALQAMQATPASAAIAAIAPTASKGARSVTVALRLPVGQGSVTVLNTGNGFFFNYPALNCANPQVVAAVVQAQPGATAWFYLHEKREALLPWLWHRGWIAILAGALALAAALWRAAVRFGPRLAPAPRLRRSISEQVRGLGAYLQGGGREALLAAQQRALTEVARRKLPRYERLSPAEKVHAIAAATGLGSIELSSALSARYCTRAQLAQYLQVLETARRRLHGTQDERRATS